MPCIFVANNITDIFVCTYVSYLCLWPSLYLPVKSVKVLCVFLPTVNLCVSITVIFCLSVLLFTLTEKSDCEKVNHVVFMFSIATTFVKLVQMNLCYVTGFEVCQSVWVSLYIFKRYSFHIIMVLCHTNLVISYFVIANCCCLTITIIAIAIAISYCQ